MNVIDIIASMYSTVETSPIVNVGVFDATFSVYLRFGHRLFLHMTPVEADRIAAAIEKHSTDEYNVSIDLTSGYGGHVLVRWAPNSAGDVVCNFGIGGAAFAIFDVTEAKAIVAGLRTCATVARDMLGETTYEQH